LDFHYEKEFIFYPAPLPFILLSCEQQTIFDQLTKETVIDVTTRKDGPACELEKKVQTMSLSIVPMLLYKVLLIV